MPAAWARASGDAQMIQPLRFVLRMSVFLLAVFGVCAVLGQGLIDAFMTSPFLNGVILAVMFLGILHIYRQVLLLRPEGRWLERLRYETRDRLFFPDSLSELPRPRLLSPMARMLSERRGRVSLSALSMRTLLDGIQNRIDESHDLSRYIIGLLIFLGLLGTFWGLAETVASVGQIISALTPTAESPEALFDQLKANLDRPLSGMGTAFTSSLFGLAGSLVVGFLELQSSQAHNRFMQDLEEWLAGITKLSSGGLTSGEGETSVPAYVQALLEQTADSLDGLQRLIASSEEERKAVGRNLGLIGERLGTLAAQQQSQQELLHSLQQTEAQLTSVLQRLADSRAGGLDEHSRRNLQETAQNLEQLAGVVDQGRQQIVQEMRNEIRLLTRTIAALAEEGQ